MRHSAILIILTFINITAFAQKRKLPPENSYQLISNNVCGYPKQQGNFKIIRSDSLKLTTYKTDSSEMIMYASHFVGFLTDWNNQTEADKIYSNLDSLVELLFQNGLLTPDLLIKAINVEMKLIDHKGDTIGWANQVKSNTVKLLNIERKKLPKGYKDTKGTVLFEVWATFNPYESGWGSFPMFELYIKAGIDPEKSGLSEYFKRAKIECLRYIGMQF